MSPAPQSPFRDPACEPSGRSARSRRGAAERTLHLTVAVAVVLAGIVLVYLALWAFLRRLMMLGLLAAALLSAFLALPGCSSGPDPRRVEAWEREVASLTSIALTVDSLPNKDGSIRYLPRTPAQVQAISEAGETVRRHGRELMGGDR